MVLYCQMDWQWLNLIELNQYLEAAPKLIWALPSMIIFFSWREGSLLQQIPAINIEITTGGLSSAGEITSIKT